jgi:hypothetical protein
MSIGMSSWSSGAVAAMVAVAIASCSALGTGPRAPDSDQEPVTENDERDAAPPPIHSAPPPRYGDRIVRVEAAPSHAR